jgi:hypothetical protein
VELVDRERRVALHEADELDHGATLSEPVQPVQIFDV